MRKSVWILAFSVFLAWQGISQATTVDALVKKLVEKRILTEKEADQLKGEIASDEKAATEEGYKKQVPEWVQNFKIVGDMRVRLQDERRKVANATGGSPNLQDRVRGRYRARLNFETKPNDKARVVIGIATDGGGPRSNNFTFSTSSNDTGTPSTKGNVVLHKAYGQYMANDRLTLTAGKMDNPIWEPMEFLWDADITPDGGVVQYNYKVNDKITLFGLGSVFMLDEYKNSSSDPLMWVGQAGANMKPNDKIDAKLVGTYTGYANVTAGFGGSNIRPSSSGTGFNRNTNSSGNVLIYRYSAPMGSGEFGLNDPFGKLLPLHVPRLGIFGEYTHNPSPNNMNTAWMAGAYLGNSKVNGFGTWKATTAYKYLGRDAWLDILPDSDFYGGSTDVKGIEGILEIGLAKNMSFVIDYYHAERIKAAKQPEHLIQYDINWKF